jgi:hypothetical protein
MKKGQVFTPLQAPLECHFVVPGTILGKIFICLREVWFSGVFFADFCYIFDGLSSVFLFFCCVLCGSLEIENCVFTSVFTGAITHRL